MSAMELGNGEAAFSVVHILPQLEGGGVEEFVYNLASGQVKSGARVSVISAGGRLVGPLCDNGVNHISFDVASKSLSVFSRSGKLAQIIASLTPDVVHTHSRIPAWMVLLSNKFSRAKNCPLWVSTLHSHYSAGWYSSAVVRADVLTGVSKSVLDTAKAQWPSFADSIDAAQVVHPGVDVSKFGIVEPTKSEADADASHTEVVSSLLNSNAGWPENSPSVKEKLADARTTILLTVGRFSRIKGHLLLLKGLAELKKNAPDSSRKIVAIAVGSSPSPRYKRILLGHAKALAVEDSIYWHGPVARWSDLARRCTALLCLSERREGFGMTAAEALSIRVPTIAWDQGGYTEILQKAQPWGLVPFTDFDILSQKIQILMQGYRPPIDPTVFTTENCIESMNSFYRHELKGRLL